MEIVTYVLTGSIKHKDTLGNEATIVPGEVERMSAGRGIQHSEFNPSSTVPTHLLQIWINPAKIGKSAMAFPPSPLRMSCFAALDRHPAVVSTAVLRGQRQAHITACRVLARRSGWVSGDQSKRVHVCRHPVHAAR
jgi:hypothetical protein